MTTREANEVFALLARENECGDVREVSLDDGCWTAELMWGGEWYPATFEDHYPDGAEIHWSQSVAS